MKIALILVTFIISFSASANIFHKETQLCVIDKINMQFFDIFEARGAKLEFGGIYSPNDMNFEAIILAKFPGNPNATQSYLTLHDGDFRNSEFLIEGVIKKKLNIETCFL